MTTRTSVSNILSKTIINTSQEILQGSTNYQVVKVICDQKQDLCLNCITNTRELYTSRGEIANEKKITNICTFIFIINSKYLTCRT